MKNFTEVSKELFFSKYIPEETKWICDTIIQRMQGLATDEDWAKFMKLIDPDSNEFYKSDVKK